MPSETQSATTRFLRVARGELIGLPVEVVESTDPTLKGLRGHVLDETLNTLRVQREGDGKTVFVAKANNVFAFQDEEGVLVRVPGERILFRPEDRIKKVR